MFVMTCMLRSVGSVGLNKADVRLRGIRPGKGQGISMASKQGASAPNPGNTAAVVTRLAQPVAEELGLLLWDVRFVREGSTWYLRIFIDKEDEDVGIDDCVAMSRRMDKILDDADPIPQAYCLEVCSPGIERELTRSEHFERFMGWPVVVRLYHAVDGEREFAGYLAAYDAQGVTIRTEEQELKTFTKKETSAVHLMDDVDGDEYGGESENE